MLSDNWSFVTAEQGNGLSKGLNYSACVVGVGAAIAGASASGTFLSSFGLGYTIGTDISKIPVYGTDQTITDWWANFWWDLLNDACNNCNRSPKHIKRMRNPDL